MTLVKVILALTALQLCPYHVYSIVAEPAETPESSISSFGYNDMLREYVEETTKELEPLRPTEEEVTWTVRDDLYTPDLTSRLNLEHGAVIHPLSYREISDSSVRSLIESESTSASIRVDIDSMVWTLNNVFNFPRCHVDSEDGKEMTASYLFYKFGSMGYITLLQTFKPRLFRSVFSGPFSGVQGRNLIALAPGSNWGTSNDQITVVGAHWDTVQGSAGFEDNGSGVVALVEVARLYSLLGKNSSNSVVFVAFDLEEYGGQGSAAFVQDFLIPDILIRFGFPQFSGAIILDSVMNFNATLGSQTISDSYKRRLSNRFAEQVDYQGSRGDFIGLLSRGPDDSFLSELFNQQWGLHGTESPANLRLMALKDGHAGGEFHQGQFPSLETLIANGDLLRSDHANFWIVNNKNFYASLPAILLTDTGPNRGVMRECYHQLCDNKSLNDTTGYASTRLLSHVTAATLSTVLHLSELQPTDLSKPSYLYYSKAPMA